MMTTSSTKFLFDQTFKVNEHGLSMDDEGPALVYAEGDIVAARVQSNQEGFAAGHAQALIEIESSVEKALDNIGTAMSSLSAETNKAISQNRIDAAQLTQTIAKKLAAELLDRQPLIEVERMIGECLSLLPVTSRVRVTVHESLVEAIRTRTAALADSNGHSGEVMIIGDANIALDQCYADWADGGAELNLEIVKRDIEAIIEQYCERQFNDACLPMTPTTPADLSLAPDAAVVSISAPETTPEPTLQVSAIGEQLVDFDSENKIEF